MTLLRRLRSLPLSLIAFALTAGSCAAADHVVLGTDWRAEAEHGGYYQALAKDFYKAAGLDVAIRQGGPQINHSQLLAAGRVDFSITSNSFIALNFARQSIPMVAIAAIFQKDPAVLIAHPGQGNDTLAALKGKPIYIGSDTRVGSWLFLKARFGYTDDQIRPYAFSIAPFLVNKKAIQQGYLGSEPFLIEQQGIKPVVMLLADAGYESYGSLIETSRKLVERDPGLVRRFVQASIKGWADYLHDDPAPADRLIKRDNPEMTDALLAYGRARMNDHGIVESGDAKRYGIGAMDVARWGRFVQTMTQQGLYPAGMDWRKAFVLDFVGHPSGAK